MKDDAISRRLAIETVAKLNAIHGSEGSWIDQKEALEALNNLPSVHSKGSVTCRDCKYSDEFEGDVWICRRYKEPFRVLAIDTCNVAERKEDD